MRKSEFELFYCTYGRALEVNAKLVLTDSGRIHEETYILEIPCVTLRDNTEILEVWSNILAGRNPTEIIKSVDLMLNKETNCKNTYGDGTAGKQIVAIFGALK